LCGARGAALGILLLGGCGGRSGLDALTLSGSAGSGEPRLASGGSTATGGSGEGGRVAGEGGRVAGEGGRVAGEGGRVAGEGGRVAGEGGRVAGAGGRVGGAGGLASTGGTSTCGNGVLELGEGCDDGQRTPGDGCSASCRPEAVKIVARGDRTCALGSTGVVKCWGENRYGWLGLGDTRDRGVAPGDMGENLPGVSLGTGRRAIDIDGSCAILDDRSLKCWGYNETGALGQGDFHDRGDKPGEMGDALLPVDLGSGRVAVAVSVSAGSSAVCAILDDASLKCWGSNSNGLLGLGDEVYRGVAPGQMGDALPRVDLGSGRTVRNVSVGSLRACAILDDASVKCWGYNTLGLLGLGDTKHRGDDMGEMGNALAAVSLGSGSLGAQVSVGSFHTCARFQSGAVKCWGDGAFGELGLGDGKRRGQDLTEMGDALPFVDWGAGAATQISAGLWYTCALMSSGAVKCWGDVRQLGLGESAIEGRGDDPGEMGDALPAVNLGTGRFAKLISAGNQHSCALLDDGTVKCWGTNQHGQLGLGDREMRGDDPGEMGDALPAVDLGF